MISIIMASCLNSPEREEYLEITLDSLRKSLLKAFPDAEIIIAFGTYGKEVDGCRCYTHCDHGLGHSYNWGIKNAKYEWILQLEDDWRYRLNDPGPECISPEVLRAYILNYMDVLRLHGGVFHLNDRDCSHHTWYKAGDRAMMLENGFIYRELNRPITEPNWRHDLNMYYYNNGPQLKHRSLHDLVGWYDEDTKPPYVEENMCKTYYDSGQRVFFNNVWMFGHIGKKKATVRLQKGE